MLGRMQAEVELLARHIRVLRAVMDHQPIGIMKLSELLDEPFHRIRYSLRVLEQTGYIQASPAGAVATPLTGALFLTLDTDIEDIIALLSSVRDSGRGKEEEKGAGGGKRERTAGNTITFNSHQ